MDSNEFEIRRDASLFSNLSEGFYPSRICALVKLGTQKFEARGKVVKQIQYYIAFEMAREPLGSSKNDHPVFSAIKCGASLDGASMLSRICAAAGIASDAMAKGFSLADIVGKVLTLRVQKNENGFNTVAGFTKNMRPDQHERFTVKPEVINPITLALSEGWDAVEEYLASLDHLPGLFGESLIQMVAHAEELNDVPGILSARSGMSISDRDDNEAPF